MELNLIKPLIFTGALLMSCATSAVVLAHADESAPVTGDQLKLENLFRTALEGVAGAEVIVSRATLPPHTTLPKHWHPGEEFAYVLEGSVTLWQKDKEDIVGVQGDVLKIPLKQIHAAITGDDGAVILIFRIHEAGQPERFEVED